MQLERPIAMRAPSGDLTLMFTDIEGSTKGWDTYQEAYRNALETHNAHMRQAIAAHRGYEVKTIGDSFMVAFSSPLDAASCALEMQRLIESAEFDAVGKLRVRIGLHSGTLEPHGGDYFGPTVNHAARIESAGHGGQVVLSEETAERVRAELPAGASLSDEGLHRLKDLGEPVRLFLLTHDGLPERSYPPLRTLNMRPHNFPAQVTSFIGREREQEELLSLITERSARLITLTGPGGTGKSRLSMQVAAEAVQEYKEGIWLVELASLTDAREVPAALALALKIPITGETAIPAQVFAYLKEKTALIVIDNFEQVVDAASFVSNLLKQCQGIVCLVTSQHLLQIAGEMEYPLSPLDLPPPGATLGECYRNPTVQLFAERAQAAKAAFELTDENIEDVVEICRRLEGLPLAVELTAALVRAMSPRQILPRLQDRYKLLASTRRDLDPRQRSLRGALDWSYELLSEDERAFFAEISVFSGGFDVDDLEAISMCEDGFLLAMALRDKSLLRAKEMFGETRYLLLETVRGYAAEKLAATGEAQAIQERHADHFLQQAREWCAALNSSGDAMQRTITDIDNLRAGMDWAIEENRDATVIAYGEALARFFVRRGLYDEGERRLQVAEVRARENGEDRALAYILLIRGLIAYQRGQTAAARAFYQESYNTYDRLGDTEQMIRPLGNLGGLALLEGDHENARLHWEQGLKLARQTGQVDFETSFLSNLATIPLEQEQYEEAVTILEESLVLHRKHNNRPGIAYALLNCAEALGSMGEYPHALKDLLEADEIFNEIGDKYGKARTLVLSGIIMLAAGDPVGALRYSKEGLHLAREMCDAEYTIRALITLSALCLAQGNLADAWDQFLEAAHIALERQNKRNIEQLIPIGAKLLGRMNEIYDPAVLSSGVQDPNVALNLDQLTTILRSLIQCAVSQAD